LRSGLGRLFNRDRRNDGAPESPLYQFVCSRPNYGVGQMKSRPPPFTWKTNQVYPTRQRGADNTTCKQLTMLPLLQTTNGAKMEQSPSHRTIAFTSRREFDSRATQQASAVCEMAKDRGLSFTASSLPQATACARRPTGWRCAKSLMMTQLSAALESGALRICPDVHDSAELRKQIEEFTVTISAGHLSINAKIGVTMTSFPRSRLRTSL
jgi:hypothetical protein